MPAASRTAGAAHPWSSFDLSTILRYLASTMKAGDPMGILLLRTVLSHRSGIQGVRALYHQQAKGTLQLHRHLRACLAA